LRGRLVKAEELLLFGPLVPLTTSLRFL